jgi:hypothetical protein
MLLYRHDLYAIIMKLPVVAKGNPIVFATDFKPNVIPHILGEIVLFAVVIFNHKWRLDAHKRLGKTLAEIAIKIER